MMRRQFGRFCAVGSIGFLVDAALLQSLISIMGMGPYLARIFSFLGASTLTWALNRSYTFQGRLAGNLTVRAEWLRYTGLMVLGAVVNYSTYACCLMIYPLAARFPVLGVAAGSLAGLVLNYATSRRLLCGVSK